MKLDFSVSILASWDLWSANPIIWDSKHLYWLLWLISGYHCPAWGVNVENYIPSASQHTVMLLLIMCVEENFLPTTVYRRSLDWHGLWWSRILVDMILRSKRFGRQWSCLWHIMNYISRLVSTHHVGCCCMDPQELARPCLQRLLHITQLQLSFVSWVLSLCRSILERFVPDIDNFLLCCFPCLSIVVVDLFFPSFLSEALCLDTVICHW